MSALNAQDQGTIRVAQQDNIPLRGSFFLIDHKAQSNQGKCFPSKWRHRKSCTHRLCRTQLPTIRIHLPAGALLGSPPDNWVVDRRNILIQTGLRVDFHPEVTFR